VVAPRPDPGFFVGAFRAVDLAVDACAGARFVEVVLADEFLAEAFFADFDLGGLA
jgi:hypothetical protein